MSDEQGGGGGQQGGGEGGGAGAAEMGGGQPQGGGGASSPEWMSTLPDDLKGDATLARYPDIPTLAKANLDLRRQASSRIVLPGENASEADLNSFYTAIGRPESADKYVFPDGVDGDTAKAFGEFAFKTGLPAGMAKAVAEFDMQRTAAAQKAWNDTSKAELDALRGEMPDYDARLTAAKSLLKSTGVDDKTVEEIELRLGTGNMMKFFFGLAAKAGEAPRIDGDRMPGGGGGGDPDKALSDKMKDASWRERARLPGTPERQEYDRLLDASAKAEQGRRQAR